MKKILFVSLLCLMFPAGMSAQSKWSVTPKAGVVVSNYNQKVNYSTELSNHWDFTIGADVECRFSNAVGLLTGLDYSRIGAEEKGDFCVIDNVSDSLIYSDATYRVDYLQVPLMLNVYIAKGLALKAGLQVGFRMGTYAKVHVRGKTIDWSKYAMVMLGDGVTWRDYENITIDVENKGSMDVYSVDFGLPLGASFEWKDIVIDAKYYFGLTNISKAKNVTRNNRSLALTIGYKFNL